MRTGDYHATEPYKLAETVTPHDATNFTNGACDALFVGTGGTELTVIMGGAPFTFTNVPNGTLLRIKATRVNDTSTDATNLVALFYGK